MSILRGAKNISIQGGTYITAAVGCTINVNQRGESGTSGALKDLSAAAAHTALHNSAARFNAPRCHRNTRTQYLHKFEQWMLGEREELHGKRLIWLNGGAGAGKSAIMQSIIERAACHTVILGAFFFLRSDPVRNYAEVLIPTLAYQVARTFPAAMDVLAPVILGDPLIFQASLYIQAYQLLVRPILHLIETGIIDTTGTLRRVFIIDGVDECSDPQKQALIIKVIASILRDYDVPISFLISSRPEVAITSAFQREKQLVSMFASISLHEDDDAHSDIRQFIEDSFLDILDNHPLRMHIKLPWPGACSVNHLVQMSSGHFIYAATAMKFIASADEHPGRALKVVEGIEPSRTGSPFAELDALYAHILTHARYSKEVLCILKHYYLTKYSRPVAAVCYIHNISPEDVMLFLSDIQSLISLTPNNVAELTITPKHASLHDFLIRKERSGALYINEGEYHASLLERYFQLVDNGARIPATPLSYRHDDPKQLIIGLANAIRNSQDRNLCLFLINRHSCYDIWNFCAEVNALDTVSSSSDIRFATATSIFQYMHAIRKFSIDIHDKTVFFHQFKQYVQLALDDLADIVHRSPQYRIIPAIMFSSSPSGLYWAFCLLEEWGRRFRIDPSYRYLFCESEMGFTDGEIDLSLEVIRSLPQSRVSWGSDFAILMKLVLEQLVDLSKPSHMPYNSPHKQWLQRQKPLKRIALGSPRLSSTIFSNLFMLTCPDKRFAKPPCRTNVSAQLSMWSYWHGYRIYSRRMKCLTLLKAVILYSRKSHCTIEVVKLARKSLPLAAQWYPQVMKRARAELDAYVDRWEDSSSGLLGSFKA